MMKWTLLLIFSLFSFSAVADISCPWLTGTTSNLKGLNEISKNSCMETLKSRECQDLFAKMRAAGEQPEDKALKCHDRSTLSKMFEEDFDFRVGCAIGGWNFVKDTFVSIGTAIGEGAAKIVIDMKQAKAENEACDADPNIKKNLVANYNNAVPRVMRIPVPADSVINRTNCASIKATLAFQKVDKANQATREISRKMSGSGKPNLTADEQEFVDWSRSQNSFQKVDLVALAKDKIKEMGVKLECYNTQERAAMICEAVAEVATLAAGPAGAALKAAKAKNILKIAGMAAEAESAGTAASTASRFVASAADLEKAAKLSNVERIAAAEKSLGRSLSATEKQALLDAHDVAAGTGRGYGTYSATDLKQKADILKKAGFSDAERESLLRQGLAGSLSDTRAAKNNFNVLRLQADKQKIGGSVAEAKKTYQSAADTYEVVMKDAAYPKSSRDYWVGAKLNADAGRYDKAGEYFIQSFAAERNADTKARAVFEALNREKDELRVIAYKNPGAASAQVNYENHRKLIEAVVNNPRFPLSDAIKRELSKP